VFKYLVPDPDMSNIFVFMNRSQPNDDPRSRRVKIRNRSVSITIYMGTDRRLATKPESREDSGRCHPPPVVNGVGVGRVLLALAPEM